MSAGIDTGRHKTANQHINTRTLYHPHFELDKNDQICYDHAKNTHKETVADIAKAKHETVDSERTDDNHHVRKIKNT